MFNEIRNRALRVQYERMRLFDYGYAVTMAFLVALTIALFLAELAGIENRAALLPATLALVLASFRDGLRERFSRP